MQIDAHHIVYPSITNVLKWAKADIAHFPK